MSVQVYHSLYYSFVRFHKGMVNETVKNDLSYYMYESAGADPENSERGGPEYCLAPRARHRFKSLHTHNDKITYKNSLQNPKKKGGASSAPLYKSAREVSLLNLDFVCLFICLFV